MFFPILALIASTAGGPVVPVVQLDRPTPPPVASVRCGAATPAEGEAFEGPVLHVFDGATLCVAKGPDPSQWIPVELADPVVAGGRQAMMAAAFAKRVVCVAGHAGARGVLAHCQLDGRPLEEIAASGPIRAIAASWR
jgi:hypothetical protein